ncbi:SLATT domain-containing protein [Micromonospora sp. WMMD1155]|uniref:SLATT domain-containing protein n=1 Tax=Micromonospora sp. WMMD1155 TaxID=3016094 RepID=UPI00249B4E91|nr:SLATT domain-containing protein [Micromonospora sp. WMMD1155]WFE50090.1 SLATT domain-containing protein [Micromonospora sp. WMMD1155]
MPENGHQQEQLLVLNHEIRQTEHELRYAQNRRRWSNLSMAFGPALLAVLYALYWLPWLSIFAKKVILIPAAMIALLFGVAAFWLKRYPGGHLLDEAISQDQRHSESDLELKLARLRDERKLLVANLEGDLKVRRVAYKEDAYSDIDQLRGESRRYRLVNNMFQGFLIIGSLAATGIAGISDKMTWDRWTILGLTFLVGTASGFMGYYKYKERSFYLQQTADAIEAEWEAVEVGVGRYKRIPSETEQLAEFVEEVHRLKSEQKKRQQNLEQPPESRHQGD